MNYQSFFERTSALLKDKPAGTGILIAGAHFFLESDGTLSSVEVGDKYPADSCQCDESAWNVDAFEGTQAADYEPALSNPVFQQFPALNTLHETDFGTYAFVKSGIEITGFLTAENTIGQYDPSAQESESIPRGYGFSIIETGGGLTAWHQNFLLDGEVVNMMITDTEGTTHALDASDRLLIGLYRGEDAGQDAILMWEQDNFPLDAESNPPEIQ